MKHKENGYTKGLCYYSSTGWAWYRHPQPGDVTPRLYCTCTPCTPPKVLRADVGNKKPSPGAVMSDEEKIQAAIDLAVKYGGIDGSHHKDWVIDQMVRVLAGEKYEEVVSEACANTYSWKVGLAP